MIKENIIEKIRQSNKCKGLLQAALNVSTNTLVSYLERNDIMLTTIAALNVIVKFTGAANYDEILEAQEA